MTESPPAESGWAWCRSLNFWLQLLAWLFFVLLFLHIHKCPRADVAPAVCCVCLQQWSLAAHQDPGWCWCAVPGSPSCILPWPNAFSSGMTSPQCSESSCQQLCMLAVSVCTPMGWTPSVPLCWKGTPGPCQHCPTPFDHPTAGFTGLDSLLPIAVGWELAGHSLMDCLK